QLLRLHAILGWGKSQKLIASVPDFPTVKVPKKKPQPVPKDSAMRLFEAADFQLRAFLLCGWLAGLRRGEALALRWTPSGRWPWLDLVRKRIVLPAEFVKAVEDQEVALNPDLEAVLCALPRSAPTVFDFHGQRGPLSPSGVSRRITDLARKVGVRLS